MRDKKQLDFFAFFWHNKEYAEIAQLVEQRIRNAWVVCSNHILGTTYLSPQINEDFF